MTAREHINYRLRVWGAIPLVLCVVFLFGMFATAEPGRKGFPQGFLIILVSWFVGIGISGSVVRHRLVCPNCKGSLFYLSSQGYPLWLKLPKLIKYCPFCGIDFDEDLQPGQPAAQKVIDQKEE